ncbi:hypothetical protein ABIE08_004403 [Kaistia defluvii]|uniref:Uncharacterized protein n=1 Tax=Kaistia defluvii TaxID=410841 RepID=A0ABV2R710_9HYPH
MNPHLTQSPYALARKSPHPIRIRPTYRNLFASTPCPALSTPPAHPEVSTAKDASPNVQASGRA